MKVDNNRNVIPFDTTRAEKKSAPKQPQAKAAEKSSQDQVDARLSNALENAVQGIKSSGLTPGQVHSEVDEVKASGLLKSSNVDSSKPRPSDAELLKIADKVASDSKAAPEKAVSAFNELDSSRVAQLVQG